MNETMLEELLEELLSGRISPADARELVSAIDDPNSRAVLEAVMEARFTADDYELPANPQRQEMVKKRLLEKILAETAPARKPARIWSLARLAAAAVLFFAIAGAAYLALQPRSAHPDPAQPSANAVIRDVAPGHKGAVLTIEHGRTIVLDTARAGYVLPGFNKSAEGLVVGEAPASFATLTTAAGQEEQLTLSDGTRIWLNAGSSIRFPTVFTGTERVVELQGEAYFEVIHQAAMPFRVKVNGEVIEDIGTRFNINAYANEGATRTTVVEGSVKVGQVLLHPGQQYRAGQVSQVNAEATIAWVQGYFQFLRADIQTMMRQISRWYDVEVRYEGAVSKELFVGKIPRNIKLSEALDILSSVGIHYTLDGKKLLIRP